MDLMNDSKGKKTNCECKDDKVQQGEKGPPSERTKGLVPAVPPVLKNVGKLAAGVAGMASGSATEKKVECKSAKTTSTVEKPKKISACIEYGTTKPNEYKNEIQNKEPVFNHYFEDTDVETCCSCTCKESYIEDKSRNPKVKFQEPTYWCPKNWAKVEKKCSAMKSNTQIDYNKTDYYACKAHQCPNLASNLNQKRYDDLINEEDIVFTCDIHDYNNVDTKLGMSTFMNSTNYFESFEKSETLNQNLQKLEESTSGFNKTKNELDSNKNDEFKQSNTVFNRNDNSNKNPPNGYSETNDLNKLQKNTSEIQSTKNIVVSKISTPENINRNAPNDNLEPKNFLPSQMNKPVVDSTPPIFSNKKNISNNILEPKNSLLSQMDKPDISLTKNTSLLSNSTSKTTNENSNRKIPINNLDKPDISLTKNVTLLSNNADLSGTSKTNDENSNKNIPTDNLETINLTPPSMDKPEISLTKTDPLLSSNAGLPGTSKITDENSITKIINFNLASINITPPSMDKPEISLTKTSQLSNNAGLPDTSTTTIIDEKSISNVINLNLESLNLLKPRMDKPEISLTKIATQLSNNADLPGSSQKTTESSNRNTPNDNLEPIYLPTSIMVKPAISLTKNVLLSSIIDIPGTSKSTNENSNRNTSNNNLEHLRTPKMDKPKISFSDNILFISNTADIPSTSKTTNENVNKNTPNDNLEHQMDKPEFDSTKNTPLLSNNVDLFGTSNTLDAKISHANSAPTVSLDFDLFGMINKQEILYDSSIQNNDSKYQNPIDLFARSNLEKDSDIIRNELFMNVEELQTDTTVNTTKSAPLFSNNIDLFRTFNKEPYINNNNTVKKMIDVGRPSALKFSLVDVTDLSYLPEIGKNTKHDPYFIHRRTMGVNNCNCKDLAKDKDKKSSINGESCKMYTTMLGINACSHVGGNPRNKTALQPGHSLMDWIRLSHSGKDLTGVGPRAGTLSVSHKQLAEHNTENDAWIAIRGKVYNITAYFDFHPGGKEELMKGVGQDATQMFNAVHPWVNYESILQKCLVGRLTTLELDEEVFSLFYGRSNQTIQVPKNFRFLSTTLTNLNGGLAIEKVIHPKFDWMQQLDYITTTFSTKPLSNAQVQVTPPTKENKLEIQITYCNHIFKNHLHFSNNIHWPCKVTINWDTGKIDVSFRKIVSKVWDTYGTLTQESEIVTEDYEYEKIKYIVLNNVKENHNTHLIAFQRIDGVKQTIPIGFHVKVYGTIDDQELIRCYTPVPCSFMRKYSDDYEAYRGDVCLLIKSYPEGLLSPTICNSVKGEVFEFSPPLGVFNMEKIASRSGYLFLAAGSGITPMLAIIKFILESTQIKCEKLYLLYFNRAEEDIILRKHFDSLSKLDERVIVKYILSQPTEDWNGLSGHIDFDLLKTSIDELCTNTQLFPVDIFSLICGPLVFSNLAKSILVDIGYTDDNIHLFGA